MYAVKIVGISKKFKLYQQRTYSLKEFLIRRNNQYEEFWALKNININIPKGKTVGLVGKNGSGKSTLLKIIARILKPTEGFIEVNGKVSALLELGAGFQSDFTGRENIFLNGSILGLSNKEITNKMQDIIDFSELEDFIDTPVRNYSSGMYMRLAFAIAVNVDPDILLVDEVLAVGDEAFQKKCLEKINEYKAKGKTIIIVSHSADLVEAFCDLAVLLKQGQVEDVGTASEIIKKYRMLG
ncbi:ABC transporter ATP-binding protein [Carboxydocella sp. ULO1]|uniref:ABC transporter ATP-binding protein n=1 Tax=Carboxydocella sp. ULO1 TaxID=1926599 RepID=UPI0009AC00FE|nr:ABC transporter ATP-binding protein [Carboxydocella sp. ULO1]GAW29464.1 ATP-binding protein [Carboxydocella sp. ULO1]